MQLISLPILLLSLTTLSFASGPFAGIRRSEENGPCTGKGGAPGVCIATAKCTDAGGEFISNACPGTPNDIKCCTKTACGTGNKGNCRFTSSCDSGVTETNKCPGPSTFKCCLPPTFDPPGSYPPPTIPSSSSGCKSPAISGAQTLVSAFPGLIREIGCIRKCEPGDSSDHCTGMATELMVTEAAGRTSAGQPIAEYVRDNCADLKCKYVMWGQRIWERGVTGAEVEWEMWPWQACTVIPDCVRGDRGGNTANHWDHVHVSYE